MKLRSALLLALLLLPSLACAGWVDRNGTPSPDAPDRKSCGDFGAWLVLTDKEEEAFTNWDTPSEGVHLPSTEEIERGKALSTLLIFAGCAVDNIGNCNLLVKYKILQPDGSVYADLPYQEAWIDKPVPPNKTLGLSVGYVKVIIENDEPLGKYTVHANVFDKNSQTQLSLTSHFVAAEPKSQHNNSQERTE